MRQATFYAGVQARNACMQLTLLYKHESLSLARRTAARAAPSAAHMGEHRLMQLCPLSPLPVDDGFAAFAFFTGTLLGPSPLRLGAMTRHWDAQWDT